MMPQIMTANLQVADITNVSILLEEVEVLDLGATPVSSASGLINLHLTWRASQMAITRLG